MVIVTTNDVLSYHFGGIVAEMGAGTAILDPQDAKVLYELLDWLLSRSPTRSDHCRLQRMLQKFRDEAEAGREDLAPG